jgi:acetyl esterase/lipase
MRRLLSPFFVFAAMGLAGWASADDSALPPGAKAFHDIAYVPNGTERQKLDLYIPAAPKGPLLVWIHGGGWISDSRVNPQGLPMLLQGYCVASLDYRYSTDAIFPAQIEDCKAALRWLRAHAAQYGYDPKRLGAMGASAGGHLVALLATTGQTRDFDVGENLDQSSAIQCGIDDFGPADFPGWKPIDSNPMTQRSGAQSIVVMLLGGSIDEKMDLARRASPVFWASKDSAPLFIQHGDADPIVAPQQSQELADKLKTTGVPVILDTVQGGHGGPGFWAGDRPQRMVAFLNQYLAQP